MEKDKKDIYTQLLAFQKLNISIKKDKRNPHFKNEYASLNEVLDKVKDKLNELDVVIMQRPTANGLETILYHTISNTFVTGVVPFINATDMQKLGGAITYARRYALVSMLALEDDDDDGQKAVAPKEWTLAEALSHVAAATDTADLTKRYKQLSATMQKDNEVIAKCTEIKNELTK